MTWRFTMKREFLLATWAFIGTDSEAPEVFNESAVLFRQQTEGKSKASVALNGWKLGCLPGDFTIRRGSRQPMAA